jgi:hypothetical protein
VIRKGTFALNAVPKINEHLFHLSFHTQNLDQFLRPKIPRYINQPMHEMRDKSNSIVRSFMIPIKYLHSISTGRQAPFEEKPVRMHKLSSEEKRKAR